MPFSFVLLLLKKKKTLIFLNRRVAPNNEDSIQRCTSLTSSAHLVIWCDVCCFVISLRKALAFS